MSFFKHLFFFLGLFFFSSCSRMSTDPSCTFAETKMEVYERTGHAIYWDRLQKESFTTDAFLHQILASELSLDDVVNIALVNNKTLKAHYDNLGIAQAQRVQAALLKNPIFSFSLRCENLVDAASIIESGIVQNFLDILLKPLKNNRELLSWNLTTMIIMTNASVFS